MEQNSSSVCIATIHNEQQQQQQHHKDEKSVPLYATVIPSNARKAAKLQQQQHLKPSDHQQKTNKQQLVCGNKALYEQRSLKNIDNHIDYEDECEASSSDESVQTVELWSHEIPVWIKGEQRWISGVTDQTTCMDLIEALLIDEGVIKATTSDNNNNQEKSIYPTRVNEYVIIERWRRVEQVLDPRTKILKIWTAWGAEQAEVKFSLKRRSDSHHSSSTTTHQSIIQQAFTGDRDSGRESPTGSINSAIVRRRRHRASKSTMAWMTHGQTIHPKSQKSNIERLMKLILEQGEVIQQQLSKLRERDLEISILEDERHKTREKEHGKNYLLETYLKGLPDVDDKQETGTGNSDSGVHTEETAASPVVNDEETALLPSIDDDEKTTVDVNKKYRRSKREHELMLEHQSTKEFSSAIKEEWKLDEATSRVEAVAGTSSSSSGGNKGVASATTIDNEVAAQIDILEKLIVLNKHLQREEELCVRLSAKIKRYEADVSGLSESQVRDSLKRVNEQLESTQTEIAKMEREIKASDEELESKTDALKALYDELEESEIEERKPSEAISSAPDVVSSTTTMTLSSTIPKALPPTKTEKFLSLKDDGLSMSREYLAENIYNISKIILKSNGHPQSVMKSINQQTSSSFITNNNVAADFIRHTPENSSLTTSSNQLNVTANVNEIQQQQQIYQMPNNDITPPSDMRNIQHQFIQYPPIPSSSSSTTVTSQQIILNNPYASCNVNPSSSNNNDAMRSSINYLETINQRIQKINHLDMDINSLSNNPIIQQANQYNKLGPKKLLINTPNINGNLSSVNNIYKRNLILQPNASPSSTANYGIDLLDASQLGTLV